MRRVIAAGALVVGSALPAASAAAQTTPDESVVNSAVEREVSVPVTSVVERDVNVPVTSIVDTNDDDDDSDKTGLWGLLGLLGLAGLAGLAGRKRKDDTTYRAGTVSGDTTPRGSTSPDR